MFGVIISVFLGFMLGRFANVIPMNVVKKGIMGFICLLLFLMGISVGSDDSILASLGSLGIDAFVVTMGALLGSCALSWVLWKIFSKQFTESQPDGQGGEQ